ncbi:tripartite tricarboxylate transporter substrate binding protein [Neptunicoccus cionae]|uniref:tripartite tricarboxylate transporter substrate binding protein n=1 Tax=Neptunicoccus cionae TaxID=2035344 RepID=UPI000C775362|nr:tripartite tricarboxylate transporter substrate binding protein [Amylibacter cionae]PLS21006.1 transporter [Amylibacter cionae]
MKNLKKIGCTLAVSLSTLASPVLAEYPERPVEFVVPWPPGDIEDTLTRMIATAVRNETGVPTSTVNIAGGGGLVGATHVFSQNPDGYTVGVFTANIISTHIIRGNASYDREAFEPLAGIIGYGQVLAASADAPFNNLAELAEYAQSNDVTLGVVGLNAPPALQTLKMAETLGFEFTSVSGYDEASCLLLFNKEVDVLLGGTTMRPCLVSGEAKGLASLATTRIPIYEDVATLEEQVPGIATPGWAGIFVRKDTPQEARDVISRIAREVVESDEAQELASRIGAVVQWVPANEAAAYADAYYDRVVNLLGN